MLSSEEYPEAQVLIRCIKVCDQWRCIIHGILLLTNILWFDKKTRAVVNIATVSTVTQIMVFKGFFVLLEL